MRDYVAPLSPFMRLLAAVAAIAIALWGLVMAGLWFAAAFGALPEEFDRRRVTVLVLAPILVVGAWLWVRHFGRTARDGFAPPRKW